MRPDGIDFIAGAAGRVLSQRLPVQALTAWHLLHTLSHEGEGEGAGAQRSTGEQLLADG